MPVIAITIIFEVIALALCFTSFYYSFIGEYEAACQLLYPATGLLFFALLIKVLIKGGVTYVWTLCPF